MCVCVCQLLTKWQYTGFPPEMRSKLSAVCLLAEGLRREIRTSRTASALTLSSHGVSSHAVCAYWQLAHKYCHAQVLSLRTSSDYYYGILRRWMARREPGPTPSSTKTLGVVGVSPVGGAPGLNGRCKGERA